MWEADDVLSNSLILTALLCGVIFGFAFTILVLHANDCRVFDVQGKYIPGPLTNLWGKNLANVLSCARVAKKISSATCDELLNELGDGDIVAFNSIFGRQTVVVGHPELIKSVLSGHHLKFLKTSHMNRLKFFLGEGLFTSEGSRWAAHRQLIGAGFQSENLKSMIPNFNLQTQRIVKYWLSNISKLQKVDSTANSIPVNLKSDFHHLTMSIMCYSAFSYDFQNSTDRDTISAAFEMISCELNERNNDPYDWWHLLYPTRTGSTKSALDIFHPLLDQIISDRLVEYTNSLNRRLKRRTARRLQNLSSSSMDSSDSCDDDLSGLKVIVNNNPDDTLHTSNNGTSGTSIAFGDYTNTSRIDSLMHNPNDTHATSNTNTSTHTNNTTHTSTTHTNTTHTNTTYTNTSTSSTAPPTFQRGSSATHTSTNGDKTSLHIDVSPATHPNPHTTHHASTAHTTHTTHSSTHNHTNTSTNSTTSTTKTIDTNTTNTYTTTTAINTNTNTNTNNTTTIPYSTSNTSLHGSSSNTVTSPYARDGISGFDYEPSGTGGEGGVTIKRGSRPASPMSSSAGATHNNTAHTSASTTTNTTYPNIHQTTTTHTPNNNTTITPNNTNTTNTTTNTNSTPNNTTTNTKPRARTKDLLDLLIHCGDSTTTTPNNKLSRTEIRDHLFTFLTTGHETTSACLQWTVFELCRNREVQRRCQAEIDAVLEAKHSSGGSSGVGSVGSGVGSGVGSTSTKGSNTNTNTKHNTNTKNTNKLLSLSFDDINKLHYLVQVLKESMRLHSIKGNITRECSAECSVGQYKLKAGTVVIVSTLAAHLHPDFWDEPLLFKPERFSRENIRSTVKHPYQYIPFSAGPRSCIGQKFALMEVLVVLGNLLMHFNFSLAAKDSHSVTQEETFTIHPKDLNVVVSLRCSGSDSSGGNSGSVGTSGGSGSGGGSNTTGTSNVGSGGSGGRGGISGVSSAPNSGIGNPVGTDGARKAHFA